jgi:hypothetical protein
MKCVLCKHGTTTPDNVTVTLEQENLVTAIWSAIDSPHGEATPTIH